VVDLFPDNQPFSRQKKVTWTLSNRWKRAHWNKREQSLNGVGTQSIELLREKMQWWFFEGWKKEMVSKGCWNVVNRHIKKTWIGACLKDARGNNL
jgi:hypothetical protein